MKRRLCRQLTSSSTTCCDCSPVCNGATGRCGEHNSRQLLLCKHNHSSAAARTYASKVVSSRTYVPAPIHRTTAQRLWATPGTHMPLCQDRTSYCCCAPALCWLNRTALDAKPTYQQRCAKAHPEHIPESASKQYKQPTARPWLRKPTHTPAAVHHRAHGLR
jgi:hypothetical protein